MKKYGLMLFLIFSVSCFSKNEKSQQLQADTVKKKIAEEKNISEENTNEIYKDRMKNFIREIRNDAGKSKYIITQNGNELYFRDGKLDKNFFSVTDGTTQESLYYGDVLKYNATTKKESKDYMLSLLHPVRKEGKPVFVINYAKGNEKKEFLTKEDIKTGFVSELLPEFEARAIYSPIQGFNSENITNLRQVKNYLLLLNPEKFTDINQYFEYLKNTDFDLLLIEPSHNGVFFTKNQVEQLKIKKNGGKRIVISYLSIGEAEDYRAYWKKEWSKKWPKWIVKENPDWKGNYIVKYWNSEWKSVIQEYREKLDLIGVDGYLLDTVDSYYYFQEKMEKGKKIPD
jgi:hypothetical protein